MTKRKTARTYCVEGPGGQGCKKDFADKLFLSREFPECIYDEEWWLFKSSCHFMSCSGLWTKQLSVLVVGKNISPCRDQEVKHPSVPGLRRKSNLLCIHDKRGLETPQSKIQLGKISRINHIPASGCRCCNTFNGAHQPHQG